MALTATLSLKGSKKAVAVVDKCIYPTCGWLTRNVVDWVRFGSVAETICMKQTKAPYRDLSSLQYCLRLGCGWDRVWLDVLAQSYVLVYSVEPSLCSETVCELDMYLYQ